MDARLLAFVSVAAAFCLMVIAEGGAPLLVIAHQGSALGGVLAGWWRVLFVAAAAVCLITALLAIEIRRVPTRWTPLVPQSAAAARRHDAREVAFAVLREKAAPIFALLAVAWLGPWWPGGRSGQAMFWEKISDWDFDNGRGTVVVAAVTLGIAVFGYLFRMSRTRLHTAQALLREIRVKHRGNVESGHDWTALRALVARVPAVQPIVTVDPDQRLILEAQKDSLTLLPATLLEAVVSFYINDDFFAQALLTLGATPFSAANPRRRQAYIENLAAFWNDRYLPSAETAIYRLALYCRLRTLLPI